MASGVVRGIFVSACFSVTENHHHKPGQARLSTAPLWALGSRAVVVVVFITRTISAKTTRCQVAIGHQVYASPEAVLRLLEHLGNRAVEFPSAFVCAAAS